MKFWNKARLFLAVYDFEAHIMLSLCLTFQDAGIPVWKKFNFNVAVKYESSGLVSLTNAYNNNNSSGLIKFKEKI